MFYIENNPNEIGIQLGHHNILSSKGIIRIAKYRSNYNPKIGFGYNLDIHFKILVRVLKKKRFKRILYQKYFLDNINTDILKIIENYLY